ncbi:MAG: hypothetical protein IJS32_04450 [Kiritimatiellae bacterium]|nr:hypothetical protein [Kiritimatiellia bacterium]
MKKTGFPFRKLCPRPAWVACILLLAASSASAAFSPLQIGLGSPDWQLVSEDTPVIGLRLNLPRSFNDTVAGLDLGILSDDTGTFSGLRLNAVSCSHACNGIAIALFDMNAFLRGIQIAPIAVACNACGLQMGLGTDAEELHGVQIGLFNGTRAISRSPTVHGLQIGIVNCARSLHGVQLGLLNIATDSPLPFLPLLRVSF